MAKEAVLWQWLRSGLQGYGHLVRIENLVAAGTPDVNFAIAGNDGWIELKSTATLPKRSATAVFGSSHNLGPEQIEWLVQRARHSSSAFIGARAEAVFWLIPAAHATLFNSASLVRLNELAVFKRNGRMAADDWAECARVLAKRG